MKVRQLLKETQKLLEIYRKIKVGDHITHMAIRATHDGLCHASENYGYTLLLKVVKTYCYSKGIGDFRYLWPVVKRTRMLLSESDYKKSILPRIEWLEDVITACEYLLDNDKTKYELI